MYDNHGCIKLKKGRNRIACLGDAHRGHPNHVEKQFNKAKKDIKDEKMYVVLMGDMIECREPSHPFYVPGAPTINDQMTWYCDLIDEFSDNDMLLGVLIGNHEHALIQKTSSNDIKRYCDRLKVPYMDYMGVMDVEYEDYTYSIAFHHGAGGGTTVGGQMNKLMGFVKNFSNYDAVIMAHTHQLAVLPPRILLDRDKEKHKNVDRYCIPAFTGSFFLTYKEGLSEYGERKGYSTLPIGFNELMLDSEQQLAQSRSRILRVHEY
jgi:hypothetical protein